MTKYIAFCTPKAFAKTKEYAFPEDMKDIEIVPTTEIYMNLLDPEWDADRCDNIVYIIERKSFEEMNEFSIKFRMKNK